MATPEQAASPRKILPLEILLLEVGHGSSKLGKPNWKIKRVQREKRRNLLKKKKIVRKVFQEVERGTSLNKQLT